jgi:cation diffusion facilitator CzcD-associated flavoprotein CzcO
VHRLRRSGFSVRVFESADDIGGTWYWNRYPGARVDIPSVDYMYSFDPDWRRDWQWSEKYATQPEILRYLNHVAEKFDLRRDLQFKTRVEDAHWDERTPQWHVRTDRGSVACRFLVMATGCLSIPKQPDIDGIDRFRGEVLFTSLWPQREVDFIDKRVAVIGTGSSGIQTIPHIAAQARELVVFQRTPNFSIPAHNGPLSQEKLDQLAVDEAAYREAARFSRGGVPQERSVTPTFGVSAEERAQRYERAWQIGELLETINVYADLMTDPAANHELAEFFRNKIRATVADPKIAELLCPTTYPIGAKRMCLDTDYYATFNRPNVTLVDLRQHRLRGLTEDGIDTAGESFTFDTIVFATGFDAVTGAIVAVDITGRDGQTLRDKWAAGPSTYLGLTTTGFPNLFLITGPGSPSVLSNMMVSIEQHVDMVAELITGLRADGFDTIEPTELAEAGWMDACPGLRGHHVVSVRRLLVRGCEHPRQAARLSAVRRRCRLLSHRLRRGSGPRLPGLQTIRTGGPELRGRRDPTTAARRSDGPLGNGRAESTGAGNADPRTGARRRRRGRFGTSAGPRRRRGRRRSVPRRDGQSELPAVPAAESRPAPGPGVLPRRRMDARRCAVRRSAVP